jgi:hypothetical protein
LFHGWLRPFSAVIRLVALESAPTPWASDRWFACECRSVLAFTYYSRLCEGKGSGTTEAACGTNESVKKDNL